MLRGKGITVPIVAVTANATPKDIKRYKSIGFNAVLSKPFDLEDLRGVVLPLLQ